MAKKHNTIWLALRILWLHFCGWRQVPGYTVAEENGQAYFAVSLAKAGGQP